MESKTMPTGSSYCQLLLTIFNTDKRLNYDVFWKLQKMDLYRVNALLSFRLTWQYWNAR